MRRRREILTFAGFIHGIYIDFGAPWTFFQCSPRLPPRHEITTPRTGGVVFNISNISNLSTTPYYPPGHKILPPARGGSPGG